MEEDLKKLKNGAGVATIVPIVTDTSSAHVATSPSKEGPRRPAAPPRRPQAVKVVRLADVDQNRFQASDEFDEMRVIEIQVVPSSSILPADGSIEIQVTFFDQDEASGSIIRSRALVPRSNVVPAGDWTADGKFVTASYVVPKGFRQKEAASGRREKYYGYVVRVYHNGALQDQESRPKALLQYSSGRTRSDISKSVSAHAGSGDSTRRTR